MNDTYYTVEQISELLNIHPKTIQRYIREGKLRATKIGKGWRVSGHDLSVFTEGEPSNSNNQKGLDAPTAKKISVSSVVEIDVDGKDEAIRIINTLTAGLNAKPPEFGQSTMHTQYIEAEFRVRISLWGNAYFMAAMMDAINILTRQNEEE